MHLSSLTLKGFKSFADTTTLTLEPGVTAIVGPNGSGKSNIVDAITWVLGAQGPSALRSQKMDDVVFAGTESLAALGRAEVTLVIDNNDGELPTDTAEVSITRRLYRTGDSEYLLNGTQCRLVDLQELLSDTGVGRQQHIIVAQGQIEQVLSARPEQRRAIVEEAAGILKFRRRKERAERRLAATQENVARLSDLQREIKRQLKPLQRQSEGAKKHEQLSKEFDALRLYDAGQRLSSLQSELSQIATGQERVVADIATKQAQLAELREAISAAESELAAAASISPKSVSLARTMALAERSRGLLGQVNERLRATERDQGAVLAQDVVANYSEQQSRITTELTTLQAQRATISQELEQLHKQLASPTPNGAVPVGAAPNGAASVGAAPNGAASAGAAPDGGIAEAASTALAEAEQALANSTSTVGEATEELHHWMGRADALRLALDQVRQSSGIAALQDAQGVVGVLIDLINVKPGAERALKAAVGESLSAVVVNGVEQAEAALSALADSDTTGTVLALSTSPTSTGAGTNGATTNGTGNSTATLGAHLKPLRQFISAADPTNEQLLAPLFDTLLADTVFVDDDWFVAVKAALAHPQLTFVTTRGDRCGPKGWRIGTEPDAATAAALNDASTRIEQLKANLEQAKSAHTKAAQTAEQARQLSEQSTALTQRDKSLAQRQDELTQRNEDITARLAGHNEAMTNAGNLQARHSALVAGLTALADRLTATRQRLDAETQRLRQRDAARYEQSQRLRERLDVHRNEHSATTEALAELEKLSTSHEINRSALTSKLEMLQTSLVEELDTDEQTVLDAPAPSLESDVTAKQRLKQVRDELKRLGPVNPLALSEFETLSERYEFVEGQLADVRQSRRELGKVIRGIDEEIKKMFAAAFADVQQLFERLFETLFPGGSGKLLLTDPSDDGAPAGTSTTSTTASTASGTTSTAAGAQISGGVDLEVRPSGKRASRLSLLSGGERSLTALAFLFAVFRSRPSPFYVLDEVEASLDDINLSRFLKLVSEFRNEVQLLIVTHQQRTMEFADVMYGVSMPPGGSSTVIAERADSQTPAPTPA